MVVNLLLTLCPVNCVCLSFLLLLRWVLFRVGLWLIDRHLFFSLLKHSWLLGLAFAPPPLPLLLSELPPLLAFFVQLGQTVVLAFSLDGGLSAHHEH